MPIIDLEQFMIHL